MTLSPPTKGVYFVKTKSTPPHARGELVLEYNVFDAVVKALDRIFGLWEYEEVDVVHGPDEFNLAVERQDDGCVVFVVRGE